MVDPTDPRPVSAANGDGATLNQANELATRGLARVAAAEAALAALLAEATHDSGGELIHDYRVALRRLRSVLRPLGFAFGNRKTRALADQLREIANLTGELRDEEVLRETLCDLDLDDATRAGVSAWMVGRTRREKGLRARVLRQIRLNVDARGGIREVLRRVVTLLTAEPKHSLAETSIAEGAIEETLLAIDKRTHAADPSDVESMHRLRIGYKRLRYTLELVHGFVVFEAAPAEKLATKLQKHLGKLHDLDEALLRMSRARGLPAAARERVLHVLKKTRSKAERRAWEEAREAQTAVAALRKHQTDGPSN
jgi:CHAD domain-containing protein